MSIVPEILKCFGGEFKGGVLSLGYWGECHNTLASRARQYIEISKERACPCKSVIQVESTVGMDSRFLAIGKVWARPVTIREIFDQWPGPYDLIAINVPGLNRDLFFTEQIQVHLAKVVAIHHEGRDQEILNGAAKLGYSLKRITRDWMVLCR